LLWKAHVRKQKISRLKERFGYCDTRNQGGIWLHAVSVGEAIAAVPLVKKLKIHYPQYPIVITTMTVTGAERVAALFDDSVQHCFVPYDLPSAIKRFLAAKKPRILIVMETELWPNLLYVCQQQQLPLLLANARLSERSLRGYQKIGFWMKNILKAFHYIAAQTREDAHRFRTLGASAQQLVITGSVKFDMTVSESSIQQAHLFRQRFGAMRPIWIAASTHEGEEETILKAAQLVLKQFPNALLLWVPRHPERFAKVMSLAKKQGLNVTLRSLDEVIADTVQVVVGDSMGELLAYYGASDVAFVGGSLIPIGGHNLLEPAMLGLPIITGPHIFNFSEIFKLLQLADALRVVHDAQSLAASVVTLLQDGALRAQLGHHGLQVVQQNQGAVDKHMALIGQLLKFGD
jgi:3-deoxy-D-manno-octulosonic-acid transferase